MRAPHSPHQSILDLCEKLDQFCNKKSDKIDFERLKLLNSMLADEELYEIGATALDCSIMLTMQRTVGHQSTSGYLLFISL